jgi:hypothetical protein
LPQTFWPQSGQVNLVLLAAFLPSGALHAAILTVKTKGIGSKEL